MILSKYKAQKTTIGDKTFDSKKEAMRYLYLKDQVKAKKISDLKLQVPYVLIPKQRDEFGNTLREVRYIADFVYKKDGRIVIEDVKGYRKGAAYNMFTLKKKLMLYRYGITVKEV